MWRYAVVCVIVFMIGSIPVRILNAEEDEGWKTTLSMGVNIASGNSETTSGNAGFLSARSTDSHEWRLGVEGSYAEAKLEVVSAGVTNTIDETTAQNAKAFINYKRKFGSIYAYSDDSIFHDDPAAVDYRVNFGVGVGVYLVQTEKSKLGVEFGGAYVFEELTTGDEDDYMAIRFSVSHEQDISKTAKIWESIEYLPRADDWDDYLLSVEAGVEAVLTGQLSLRLVLQDRYDSEPPAAKDENDMTVIGSLVFKL